MKRLNLGCGDRPEREWINHDLSKHSDHVDIAFDLQVLPWPEEYSVEGGWDRIAMRDVMEHLRPDLFYPICDQVWDWLAPDGIWSIQVPEFGSENAIIDPTHWRGFHRDSFDYLDPRTKLGKNSWTTQKRWTILRKDRKPRSNVNLIFELRKNP